MLYFMKKINSLQKKTRYHRILVSFDLLIIQTITNFFIKPKPKVKAEPFDGCSSLTNLDLLKDSIAFVGDGNCSYVQKILFAQGSFLFFSFLSFSFHLFFSFFLSWDYFF